LADSPVAVQQLIHLITTMLAAAAPLAEMLAVVRQRVIGIVAEP
jgi:hypothetical protein